MKLLSQPTRYLFFTGKGGVGKTSLACATAVHLADRGKRVLLVSTDPASNLSEVLGTDVADQPREVDGAAGLTAVNIDPEAEAQAYRERTIGPLRGILSGDDIHHMEEQLSGACTMEIASFDQFTSLLTDDDQNSQYDHVIFDTAPTGHTLRLLQLPAAWSNFLDANTSGASCLGPLSGLETQRHHYAEAVKILADPAQTTLVLVTRAEAAPLREAARTSGELAHQGIHNQQLVINGVFRTTQTDDPLAVAFSERATQALQQMPEPLRELPSDEVLLQAHNLVGVESLRALFSGDASLSAASESEAFHPDLPPLSVLVDQLTQSDHGLLLVMGKGGVGKTSIAAAVAVELARRGLPVHLSTTDPAAHLTTTLEAEVPGLRVSRIDPAVETKAYADHVLATSGKNLDEAGRELLREELRSPCTEEIAVFHAFSRLVRDAKREFVVLDTAPTGHTLLLLDATGSYHREVMRNMNPTLKQVTTPMMQLQDPNHTKVLIVTLPETTPVLEAERLQTDLKRANIDPYAWIINSSLAAASTTDPILARRANGEQTQIERVQNELAQRTFIVPWLVQPPVGLDGLRNVIGEQAEEKSLLR